MENTTHVTEPLKLHFSRDANRTKIRSELSSECQSPRFFLTNCVLRAYVIYNRVCNDVCHETRKNVNNILERVPACLKQKS